MFTISNTFHYIDQMARTQPPSTPTVAAFAKEPPRVGQVLAALREQRGLSLDELSRRAGVSKSMLSQIERGQANPTVAVVWRLSNALGVPIAEMLGEAAREDPPAIVHVPAHDTPTLRSPDGLCQLHILGPVDKAGRFEWYDLKVQPGGVLASLAHEPGTREHLSVISGSLQVEVARQSVRIRAGETARYAADQAHSIRNAGKVLSQAVLVVMSGD